MAVCHIARARQRRTLRQWARESTNAMGRWSGGKLHAHCDEAARLCAFALTTATVDDRKLLAPLTRWVQHGLVGGAGGYLSQARAKALAQRGVSLVPPTRKHRRPLASQFQLACLRPRHRVEEVVAVRKNALGAERTTPRAAQALPIPLLCSVLAYSLYKALIAYPISPGITL
jgi:hypothetical protein